VNEQAVHQAELPDIITFLAHQFPQNAWLHFCFVWQYVIYALLIIGGLLVLTWLISRKITRVPSTRLQTAAELIVGGLDDFICGILGSKGRQYLPFIGTLFIYILFMNLIGLIPFLKSATASWSTTLALAICVFVYVQYTAVREMGFLGYLDHMAGQPRGAMAFTLIMPVFMFVLHVFSELVRPLSLSLRLRSNIWGDEVLLAVLTSFGLQGLPLLLLNILMVTLTAVIQALVFSLLTMIYFAMVLEPEEKHS
jgi:F-type H+-transporting ATPase subunit a